MPVGGLYGNRKFHLPFESMIYVALKFTLLVGDTEFEFQLEVDHGLEWNVEFMFQSMPFNSIFLISGFMRYGILPNKIFSSKTALTRCRQILKTVKNVTDRPPVHTKTAHFLPADFENGRF